MPIVLVDCNNFYASCERVFVPRLRDKPVAVLSNNDGCIIARSDEVKALGIPMGAPYFKHRATLEAAGVRIFSANFELYGDLSRRVMQTLETFSDTIEVYSIDEAFLHVPAQDDLTAFGAAIHERVARWTGIPVRVGIASTKTLAKAASELAKRAKRPAFVLDDTNRKALGEVPVEDVWGIGRRWGARLRRNGVKTALDLCALPDQKARRYLNVIGLRTVYELRGTPCFPLEHRPATRKSVLHSRSFGEAVTDRATMREVLTAFVSRAAMKLRRYQLAAHVLQVFLLTGPYHKPNARKDAATINLPQATSYTPWLLEAANAGLQKAWRPGSRYTKAGVMLYGLVPETPAQGHLFRPADPKHSALMQTIDAINRRAGHEAVVFAATRPQQEAAAWSMRCALRSPRYTTRWDELLTVYAV